MGNDGTEPCRLWRRTRAFVPIDANRRHYELAARSLSDADPKWLGRLITRRVPLQHWDEALEHRPGDVKVIVEFPQG